jgi:hypothetical protein
LCESCESYHNLSKNKEIIVWAKPLNQSFFQWWTKNEEKKIKKAKWKLKFGKLNVKTEKKKMKRERFLSCLFYVVKNKQKKNYFWLI